jgi:23S rRNA (guanosine2251-2'-O)-methyltransferase
MKTLCGRNAVMEALRGSPRRVRKVVIAQGRLDGRAREIALLARSKGVPVYREMRRVLDRIVPGGHHQGVVAEVAPVPWWDLDDLLSTAPSPALLLALDRIEDPRNFGAIARTAESAAVHGIIIPQRASAPPSEVAVAASAGALLHQRLARVRNLSEALSVVKKANVWVVGLAPSAPISWFEFDYRLPVLLVVGSEGKGLRRRVADVCDQLVSLPQRGRVDSLNVSVAAGVVLYEVLRQRGVESRESRVESKKLIGS